MASPLRVKIEYSGSNKDDRSSLKFVYLIPSPATTTIGEFIQILEDYIITQFSRSNIRLVHLTTDDGYLLMKDNICNHILNNNEKLLCIDMNQFVAEHANTIDIEEAWFKLEQHDVTDNIEKILSVGINSTGKFYVYLFGGRNKREIFLFNVIELLAIARDKQKEISHPKMRIFETSPYHWFVEAIWEHDATAANNTLLLVGNLKTGDKTQVQSGKLSIHLNESTKTIENWEVMRVSDEANDNNGLVEREQARLNQLKELVPPPKRTGPVIDTTMTSAQIDTHECEGDSAIRMIQGEGSFVEVTQETSAHDGGFRNFVNITHIIISKKPVILQEVLTHKRVPPMEKSISIVRVNVRYLKSDGGWVDCQNSKIVIDSTSQNDKQKVATAILNIEPDKVVSVSIEAAIPVKGKPNRMYNTRSRAHRSLPQPLKLKIIVTDNLSKTCSLVVEQINQPLVLITRDKFLENKKDDVKKFIAFVYADDCNYDERISVGIFIDKDDCLIIHTEGKSVSMKNSQIRTLQWNAKKNNQTEDPIEFLNDSQAKITSLFDSETYLLYAIRVELTTTTSQTTEVIILPLDELK